MILNKLTINKEKVKQIKMNHTEHLKRKNNKQIKTSKRHSIALIVVSSVCLFFLLMFGFLSLILFINLPSSNDETIWILSAIWNVIGGFLSVSYFINMVMSISIGLQHKKLYPMMNLQSIWLLTLLSCLGFFGLFIVGMNIFITTRTYNKLNTLVKITKTQTPSL